MLTHRAAIGGEGNGGVMYAAVHRGRDALVAAALALELLAREGRSVGALVRAHPRYVIVKSKVARSGDLAPVYDALVQRFSGAHADQQDGLRLAWRDRWMHVRPSGTEPVIRLIAEAPDRARAEALVAACRAEVERRGSVACAES